MSKNYCSKQKPTGQTFYNFLTKERRDYFWGNIKKRCKGFCWEWTKGCDSSGYGEFYISGTNTGGRNFGTHRVSMAIYLKRNLSINEWVLHQCDNPRCVRPAHLFLGTQQDNMTNKVSKNRQNKGESHGRAKLTSKQVITIRQLYKTKHYTCKDLSKKFNVSKDLIARIINRRLWKHV